ncbi:MAG: TetR/AcrR family transcriptional regulator [Clostridia bacterium]|nr:TetR/AcrR family transcriptional regulator [Clostridia bacterium]
MEQKGLHRSTEENRRLILWAAARLFEQNGYTATTLRQIAKEAGINIGSLMYAYESKKCILVDLVKYVLDGQFTAAEKLLQGVTNDKVFF